VERGEHCANQRGVIRVPVVTSACVTGWKLPRTGWRNGCGLLCCVCCYDYTRIPSNEYDKEPFEEVAERRARVKRPGGAKLMSRGNLPIQA